MIAEPIWEELGITLDDYAVFFNLMQEYIADGVSVDHRRMMKRICNIETESAA